MDERKGQNCSRLRPDNLHIGSPLGTTTRLFLSVVLPPIPTAQDAALRIPTTYHYAAHLFDDLY